MANTSLTNTTTSNLDPTPSWRQQAACRGVNPDIFYTDNHDDRSDAIAICAGCPVQHACLEHALTRNEEHGIWGGQTEAARRRLRKKRRADGTLPARRSPGIGSRGGHGTPAGYRNHFRAGTPPCWSCRQANTRAIQDANAERRTGPDRTALAQAGWCHRCTGGDHHRCRYCACPECHPTVARRSA